MTSIQHEMRHCLDGLRRLKAATSSAARMRVRERIIDGSTVLLSDLQQLERNDLEELFCEIAELLTEFDFRSHP